MKRKIFISLDIPERDKKRLARAIEKWQELPVKWTREQNLHLTLVFLGFVNEDSLEEICEKVGRAAAKSPAFDIDFDQIELFPSAAEPRAVAIFGGTNDALRDLINDIEEELDLFGAPKKSFRPHITLGRTRKAKWEALEEKPALAEKFDLHLAVETVSILASDFSGGEGEYALIESCPLS